MEHPDVDSQRSEDILESAQVTQTVAIREGVGTTAESLDNHAATDGEGVEDDSIHVERGIVVEGGGEQVERLGGREGEEGEEVGGLSDAGEV